MMRTLSSGVILIQTFGSKAAACADTPFTGRKAPIIKPPPATAAVWRNARLLADLALDT
jgi:hypothetical protein